MTEFSNSGEYAVEEIDAAPPSRRFVDRLTVLLLTAGMIGALVSLLSFRAAVQSQAPPNLFTQSVTKSVVYYAAHAAEIVLLTCAGVVALATTRLRSIQPDYIWRLLAFFAAGALMVLRGYSIDQVLSSRIFDGWGPFPVVISLLLFIAARPDNWPAVHKLFAALAVTFSGLTVVGIAQLHSFSRIEAVSSLTGILNGLYWPATWVTLIDYSREDPWRRLRFIPLLLYAVGSLFVQTRLNLVMLAAAFAIYFYLQYQRRSFRLSGWIAAFAAVVWCFMFAALFLRDTAMANRIVGVAEAFAERAGEDTRTGQLVEFSKSVDASELVLGRGSLATWNWNGIEWYGGTDVGYLTLLLFGGIPLLLSYVWMHMAPSRVAFDAGAPDMQRVAGFIVLLWALRMFSSSYPALALEYYPVPLCVGMCISRTDPAD